MANNRSFFLEDAQKELTNLKQRVSVLLLTCDVEGEVARERAVKDVVNFELVDLRDKYSTFDTRSVCSHENLVSLNMNMNYLKSVHHYLFIDIVQYFRNS